ncbi:hypothetical protein OIO90_004675 [Microbotryomycetes sp. JL221]|nr:hypothetical protein OIO90_004675 [Microbotryomycetes sp. JL221]
MATNDPSTERETVEEAQQVSSVSKATTAIQTAWTYRDVVLSLASTGVRYYTVGPAEQSWSIETALFIAGVKSLSHHRQSTSTIKPEDVDPVKATISARKRLRIAEQLNVKNGATADVLIKVNNNVGLKGILEQSDQQETGQRTIEAEWQIHNDAKSNPNSTVLLYFHGGGYTLLNRRSHRPVTLLCSKMLNCRVLSVDYRLSPETPFPGGLHDAISAYLYLTQDLAIPAKNIIVAGDSAGGGLSLALMLYLRDMNMSMVGAGYLLSPFCDPTGSLASWETNLSSDYLDLPKRHWPMNPMRCYLGQRYDELLLHPYVTSSLADLKGLPNLLIQAGGGETLRDESTLLAQRAAAAGVEVRHEVFDGGIHVFQAFVKTDAAVAAFKALKQWYSTTFSQQQGGNFEQVDNLLQQAFVQRDERLLKQSKDKRGKTIKSETQRVVREPKFVFEPVQEPAPQVKVRDDALEPIRKAVQEMNATKYYNVTHIYKARKNEKNVDGIVGRVRGILHL